MLIIAVSCSSIKISSDFDKTAGFASYKTYSFTQEALSHCPRDLNRNRLLKAIENRIGS